MEKGRAHVHEDGRQTDGSALTSPVRRRVNYRPSNRIDVKDLRRVVLPPYSVSAVSRFLSARERESRPLVPNFATKHTTGARDPNENFLKNRLAAYPSDIGRYGRPSSHPIPTRSIRISLRPI